jgi:hypothetical protein
VYVDDFRSFKLLSIKFAGEGDEIEPRYLSSAQTSLRGQTENAKSVVSIVPIAC